MALPKATKIIYTYTAGATNVCNVKFQVADFNNRPIAGVHQLDVGLGTATGVVHGTSASGTVQAKANSGTVLQIYIAKKAWRVQTLTDGSFTLEITDSAKTTFNP